MSIFAKVNWTQLTQGLLSSLRIERELRKSRLPRLGGSTVSRFPWTWWWPFDFSDFYLLCMMIGASCSCWLSQSKVIFNKHVMVLKTSVENLTCRWSSLRPWSSPSSWGTSTSSQSLRSEFCFTLAILGTEWATRVVSSRLVRDWAPEGQNSQVSQILHFWTQSFKLVITEEYGLKNICLNCILCGLWDDLSGASETELTWGGWKWNIP